MAKKSLKGAGAASADVINSIISANTQNAAGTEDADSTHDANKMGRPADPEKQSYYHINLKMPTDYRDYLMAATYRASDETKRVTITEYICDLIRKDMEAYNKQKEK